MFGYVMADLQELAEDQRSRYTSVYCGICRSIRAQSSNSARLGLSYDMAFLALLHMSLYEPEEIAGDRACMLHPIKPRPWVDNEYIGYAADMNVALAYYNCMDDWQDEHRLKSALGARVLKKSCPRIEENYPRQCAAIRQCMQELNRVEKEGCDNPDLPAGCFGRLMGELFVYEEDLWAPTLRKMGDALGRFIYLADAAVDYKKDKKKGQYNPFLKMGTGPDPDRWEQYLVMEMGRCTDYFERLPLVQDKKILDNILYGGVWLQYRVKRKGEKRDR